MRKQNGGSIPGSRAGHENAHPLTSRPTFDVRRRDVTTPESKSMTIGPNYVDGQFSDRLLAGDSKTKILTNKFFLFDCVPSFQRRPTAEHRECFHN